MKAILIFSLIYASISLNFLAEKELAEEVGETCARFTSLSITNFTASP